MSNAATGGAVSSGSVVFCTSPNHASANVDGNPDARRRDDADGFLHRRVPPDRAVDAHHLVDDQLHDERDQQVRDEAPQPEGHVAREAGEVAGSHAVKMTPKSRTRRLVVPRPWATPYTERASRCGSDDAPVASLSGAAESRPTPVPPAPPLSQALSRAHPPAHNS